MGNYQLRDVDEIDVSRLSGNSYVACRDRGEDTSRLVLNRELGRIPIRSVKHCEHGISICESYECVSSWSIDHEIMLIRTEGGRKIAKALNIDPMTRAELPRR